MRAFHACSCSTQSQRHTRSPASSSREVTSSSSAGEVAVCLKSTTQDNIARPSSVASAHRVVAVSGCSRCAACEQMQSADAAAAMWHTFREAEKDDQSPAGMRNKPQAKSDDKGMPALADEPDVESDVACDSRCGLIREKSTTDSCGTPRARL